MGASVATVNNATEIRLLAERQMGELLAQQPKQTGGDAMKARSNRPTEVPPTLADIGITKKQMPKATGALREGPAVPERNHGEQPPTLADIGITKKQMPKATGARMAGGDEVGKPVVVQSDRRETLREIGITKKQMPKATGARMAGKDETGASVVTDGNLRSVETLADIGPIAVVDSDRNEVGVVSFTGSRTEPVTTGAKGIGPIAVPDGNRNQEPTLADAEDGIKEKPRRIPGASLAFEGRTLCALCVRRAAFL